MGIFSEIAAIIGTTLQLDVVNGGPRWKNNGGVAEFRNAGDSAYAVVRGDGSTVGANDLRPWASFALTFYIDTVAGNDANPGSAALPWRTWNGGAWPVVGALRFCLVDVEYTTATPDTSWAGIYRLREGVNLTINSPWADAGLGARVAGAGSTTTNLVDSVGGLAVNGSQGRRTRFTSGALSEDTYSTPTNTAAAFQPGAGGYRSAPLAGVGFVVEKPTGGIAPLTTAMIDGSAPGCGFATTGLRVDMSGAGAGECFRVYGAKLSLSGFEHDAGAVAAPCQFFGCTGRFGRSYGAINSFIFSPDPVALGSRGIGCFFHSTAASCPVNSQGCITESYDSVFAGASWQSQQCTEVHESPRLNGGGAAVTLMRFTACAGVQVQNVSLLGCTASPVQFIDCASVLVIGLALENTTTANGLTLTRTGTAQLANITGTLGGAGTAAVAVNGPCAINATLGGNTGTGNGGAGTALNFGGLGLIAWPGGGSFTTDITTAQLVAATNQNCSMRS
jgi:hypothetical protein